MVSSYITLLRQVDSTPEVLDALRREIIQLKIEWEALRRERDLASKNRLVRIEKELADLEEKSATLSSRWKEIAKAQKLKTELK
jgi:ATP-dependent Clp protease ATP-binding subunit ClpB